MSNLTRKDFLKLLNTVLTITGLAVIATPVGATPEILAHFDKSLLTASNRAESICEIIRYFTSRARSYTKNDTREKAADLYNWDRIIADLTLELREGNRNAPRV